ncbi:MAG: hypothetical protein WCI29_08405 [Actinomycetes bacterium]
MRRATWTLLRPTGRVSFALGHGVSSVVIAHERIRGNAALTVHLSRTSLHCPVRAYGGGVLVVTRHRLPLAGFSERQELVSECRELLALFASRPGYVRGWLTSSIDEPDLWLLAHEWTDVGSYRRALSSYEVKMHWPFLQTASDEPSAFEVLIESSPHSTREFASARADSFDSVGLQQVRDSMHLTGEIS